MAEKNLEKKIEEKAIQEFQELKNILELELQDSNLEELEGNFLIENHIKDFWANQRTLKYDLIKNKPEIFPKYQEGKNFLQDIETEYFYKVLKGLKDIEYLTSIILPKIKEKALSNKQKHTTSNSDDEMKIFIQNYTGEMCIDFLLRKNTYFKVCELIDLEINKDLNSYINVLLAGRRLNQVSEVSNIKNFRCNSKEIINSILSDLDSIVSNKHSKWSKFILLTEILFSKNLNSSKPITYVGATNTLVYLLDQLPPFFDEKISPAILSAYKLIRLGNDKYLTEGNYYAIRSRNKNKFPKYYDEIDRLVAIALKKSRTDSTI